MASLRDEVFSYVKKQYRVSPEYLWRRFPGYAVLRHKDNAKWFGLVMDVPADRLGLQGDEVKDILNVKMADPLLTDILVRKRGYFRGYHISRGSWISVLLDGTVPMEEIRGLLDESYLNTAPKEVKRKLRPPKEWIIPANPKYYDIEEAFRQSKEIDWKQGKGIRKGDIVYVYLAAPVSAVLYKCRVTKTDIPFRFDEGNVHMTSLMKIRLLKTYRPDRFTFERLGSEFGIRAVRGPRGIPDSLSEALASEK